jgi:hypothetical protein
MLRFPLQKRASATVRSNGIRAPQAEWSAPRTLRVHAALLALAVGLVGTGPTAAGPAPSNTMPAYYDGKLFTVNMKQMPHSDPLLAHNGSVNTIYASNDLDEEQDFIPVLDAIQGDGFNPLWHQVLIVFNDGFTPHQFFSDTEVLAAASGSNPEITLVATDEVYRCAVIGPKK